MNPNNYAVILQRRKVLVNGVLGSFVYEIQPFPVEGVYLELSPDQCPGAAGFMVVSEGALPRYRAVLPSRREVHRLRDLLAGLPEG
ncbi:MAG: hypothetical protein P1P73_08515 [Brevefilum sp.]|nr:hypothetical protein [Brevefilum sp.]